MRICNETGVYSNYCRNCIHAHIQHIRLHGTHLVCVSGVLVSCLHELTPDPVEACVVLVQQGGVPCFERLTLTVEVAQQCKAVTVGLQSV